MGRMTSEHKETKLLKIQKRPQRVTMETVGRMANVSQVTVSRALSNPSKVSANTLKKIRNAIEATGFVPNASASALASNRSKLISVLVPSITNIVYAAMIKTFSDRMREAGYQILLSETGFDLDEEEKLIQTHLSRSPDAILLTGIHHSEQAKRILANAAIPVVEVWDITDDPIDLCVGFSHRESGRAVAEFLVKAGYTQAGSISAGDERALRRKDAFKERFEELSGNNIRQINFHGPASLGLGREGLAQLIDKKGFESGVVFCSSDLLAHGVLIEARDRGLDVPGQIAVLGFGDQDFAKDVEPALSTVRVDRELLGSAAADATLGRLSGRAIESPIIDLSFTIVRRLSC